MLTKFSVMLLTSGVLLGSLKNARYIFTENILTFFFILFTFCLLFSKALLVGKIYEMYKISPKKPKIQFFDQKLRKKHLVF